MRTLRALLVVVLLAMPAAGGIADVRLEVVDRESQESPPVAQAPSPCNVSGFADNDGNLTSTSVFLVSTANGSVSGGDCDTASNNFAIQQFTINLIGPPGATADICYVVRFSGLTSAEGPPGNVTAQGQVGGNPLSDPGGVFLNGNPVATFQETFAPNVADSDTQRALFTATVGDVIRLETGASAFADLNGAGAARTATEAFAGIYVGACPTEHAPTASPWGLAGLAGAMATIGAGLLRRRA